MRNANPAPIQTRTHVHFVFVPDEVEGMGVTEFFNSIRIRSQERNIPAQS